MNIRKWFGVTLNYDVSPFNIYLDKFLYLYSAALNQYFGYKQVQSLQELLNVLNVSEISLQKRLFLDWIIAIGQEELVQLASLTESKNESATSIIEYEYYILSEEMGFEYPEDVRSTLIGAANCLLKELKERA